MKDQNKTKKQLIDELNEMRQMIAEYSKNSSDTLHKSNEKYAKVFQSSPDTFVITDLKEGRYVDVNDTYLKVSGYTRQEVIGQTYDALNIWVVPEERDLIIKQIKEQGSVRNYEGKFRMKSGEIITTLLSANIIDIDGEPHLFHVTKNITQIKQMEEALRFSEECFSKAFNASPVLMSITKLKDGGFVKANPAFIRSCGYNHEEIIGRTSLDIGFWQNPADRDVIKQKIIANQSVKDIEIRFCKDNGEQRMGLYSAEIIVVNGEPCILTVLTDTTELKKMEVEMTRLDRLSLVGEMAASIGHEIRNPMTTVRGYLQLMREDEKYTQEIERFDLMIEELDMANLIITDFLSLAKDKAVELKQSNLNAIIEKLMPLIKANATTRNQYIKLELLDLPDLLLDDKEIHQLIINLVNNGMESMPSDASIIIRTFVEKERVILAIQDQGHGIDPELLDKLGTPFLTTKKEGNGLGLAVCYRIAAKHNAKIDIETSSNGTTFFVSFPYI